MRRSSGKHDSNGAASRASGGPLYSDAGCIRLCFDQCMPQPFIEIAGLCRIARELRPYTPVRKGNAPQPPLLYRRNSSSLPNASSARPSADDQSRGASVLAFTMCVAASRVDDARCVDDIAVREHHSFGLRPVCGWHELDSGRLSGIAQPIDPARRAPPHIRYWRPVTGPPCRFTPERPPRPGNPSSDPCPCSHWRSRRLMPSRRGVVRSGRPEVPVASSGRQEARIPIRLALRP